VGLSLHICVLHRVCLSVCKVLCKHFYTVLCGVCKVLGVCLSRCVKYCVCRSVCKVLCVSFFKVLCGVCNLLGVCLSRCVKYCVCRWVCKGIESHAKSSCPCKILLHGRGFYMVMKILWCTIKSPMGWL